MFKEALRFLIPAVVLALICAILHQWALVALFLVGACGIGFFFRNPYRQVPEGHGIVVSPADGRVVQVAPLAEDSGVGPGQIVSIFLSIFNVHVVRSPVTGSLERLEYRKGRFLAAFRDEAPQVNEQNVLTIRHGSSTIVMKQIAGIVARRVVCWKRQGHSMDRGEVIGLIRFGSRVEVLLPAQTEVRVRVGDRVKGGSSILGEFKA